MNDYSKGEGIGKRKWLVGLSVLVVIGVILSILLYVLNSGSLSSGSGSSTYLPNSLKLTPGISTRAADQQSSR